MDPKFYFVQEPLFNPCFPPSTHYQLHLKSRVDKLPKFSNQDNFFSDNLIAEHFIQTVCVTHSLSLFLALLPFCYLL